MGYVESASQLKPLEAFDPSAFVDSDPTTQAVCDLVLALALIYNDYRDVLMAHAWLSEVSVQPPHPTPRLALESGLRVALQRFQAGVVHELLALVSRSQDAIQTALFLRLVDHLSDGGKTAWQAVQDVGLERPSRDPFAKALLLVRNKVAFHYDAGQIGVGFRRAFVDPHTHAEPMLCRGVSLQQSRFCFADAAAQAYLQAHDPDLLAQTFFQCEGEFPRQLHHALFEIVTRFVQMRGYGWRTVRPTEPVPPQ